MNKKLIFTTSCALFAMLFGAGNIVFPLILGRSLGADTPYALLGFILSAVFIPLLGFISVMLAAGSQNQFLAKLGRIPGLMIALLCMILLGPLGAIPRCIAIAHADISWYFPELNIWIFSACMACGIWVFTYEKNRIIEWLGLYLGPIKILCLIAIGIAGFFFAGEPIDPKIASSEAFTTGFYSGYGTMDLLAIIFFSGMIFQRLFNKEDSQKKLLKKAAYVALWCGLLLALMYGLFAGIAAQHGARLSDVANDTLLSALASIVLGTKAGIFANITIALTCFVTAIALSATFAEFIAKDIFKDILSYRLALIITIILSALMATLRFNGIMSVIMPLISLCYPALIVFAFFHILSSFGFIQEKHARVTFWIVFSLSAVLSFV